MGIFISLTGRLARGTPRKYSRFNERVVVDTVLQQERSGSASDDPIPAYFTFSGKPNARFPKIGERVRLRCLVELLPYEDENGLQTVDWLLTVNEFSLLKSNTPRKSMRRGKVRRHA